MTQLVNDRAGMETLGTDMFLCKAMSSANGVNGHTHWRTLRK